MSRRVAVMVCVFASALAGVGAQTKAPPSSSVRGVWRVVGIAAGARGSTSDAAALPGVFIFTEKHYSMVRVTAERPDLKEAANATYEDRFKVWSPFQAASGTYEATGSVIRLVPIVAKEPFMMTPGVFQLATFAIAGNTLSITQGAVTVKLARVE